MTGFWTRLRLVFAGVLICAFSAGFAWAERRVALVVGNSKYQSQGISPLPNPANDGADIAEILRKLDFDVIERMDADTTSFNRALSEFARRSLNADAVLFFYAGHALEVNNQNFFLPIDAEVKDQFDMEQNLIGLERVRLAMSRAQGAVRIMILDACRDNPLAQIPNVASRGLGQTRGLARIDAPAALKGEPPAGTGSDIPPGLRSNGEILIYSTQPKDVAQDGRGRNSPFTGALKQRLQEPHVELRRLFGLVTDDVTRRTGGKQVPQMTASLTGGDFFLNLSESDEIAWNRIAGTKDPDKLRDYIARFPKSSQAVFAATLLGYIENEQRRTREEEDKRQQEASRLAALSTQEKAAQEDQARKKMLEEKRKTEEAARLAAAAEVEKARLAKVEAERAKAEEAQRLVVAERAKADQIAREKAAAEEEARQAKAAAEEKIRVAKAEAEKRKAEEVARVAATQEAARLAKLAQDEQERLAKARELERIQLAEQERRDQMAREKAAAEEQKRIAALNAAEQAKAAQAEAERLKAEETQRLATLERAKADKLAREQGEAAQRKLEDEAQRKLAERIKLEQLAREQAETEAANRLAEAESEQRKATEAAKLAMAEREAAESAASNKAIEEARLAQAERERNDAAEAARVAAVEQARAAADKGAAQTEPAKAESEPAANNQLALLQTPAVIPVAPIAPVAPATPLANTPNLVKAAQTELARIGCYAGNVTGNLNRGTKAALKEFDARQPREAKAVGEIDVTPDLLDRLKSQTGQLCLANVTQPKKPASVARIPQPAEEADPAPVVKRPTAKKPRVETTSRPEPAAPPLTRPKAPPVAARPAPPVAAAPPAAANGHKFAPMVGF